MAAADDAGCNNDDDGCCGRRRRRRLECRAAISKMRSERQRQRVRELATRAPLLRSACCTVHSRSEMRKWGEDGRVERGRICARARRLSSFSLALAWFRIRRPSHIYIRIYTRCATTPRGLHPQAGARKLATLARFARRPLPPRRRISPSKHASFLSLSLLSE